jgi:hypothetical protein
VLEDHPDLLAEAAQPLASKAVTSSPSTMILPPLGFQAVDQAQHGAFAGAGMADQAEHLAIFDGQAGRVQGGDILTGDAVGFMDVLKLDHVANLVGRWKRISG